MYIVAIYSTHKYDIPEQFINPKCHIKWVHCNNGIPDSFAGKRILKVLDTEQYRCPVFIDAISAHFHSDLMLKQDVVVVLPKEMCFDSSYLTQIFNETLAISNSAKFMYENTEYHEKQNLRYLNVIDIDDFLLSNTFIEELIVKYFIEHEQNPSIILTRYENSICKGSYMKLKSTINKKLNSVDNLETHEIQISSIFSQFCQTEDMQYLFEQSYSNNKLEKQLRKQVL